MAIPNTSNSTQIGFIPGNATIISGDSNIPSRSSVIIGRNTETSWEAIGYGSGARPDIVETIAFNLSYQRDLVAPASDTNPLKTDTYIVLDVKDLVAAIQSNPDNFPAILNMKLKEVAVCEADDSGETTEKRMIIIGSQTYLPSGTN